MTDIVLQYSPLIPLLAGLILLCYAFTIYKHADISRKLILAGILTYLISSLMLPIIESYLISRTDFNTFYFAMMWSVIPTIGAILFLEGVRRNLLK